jgi:parallel beta-helix repeat protein
MPPQFRSNGGADMPMVKQFANMILSIVLAVTLLIAVNPTALSEQNGTDGSFDILVFENGTWELQGELTFSDYETLQLPLENKAGGLKLRLVQQGHDAAYVDYIALQKDDTTYLPVSAINLDSSKDILAKVLSPEYDVCDAWDSTLEVTLDNVPEDAMLLMRAMEQDLGEGHGSPIYYPILFFGQTLSYTLVNDGGIAVNGVLEETTEPEFTIFWQPDSPHPDGYTYGWLHCDGDYLYAAVEVTADNTPDEEDWGALYVMVNGEFKEFRISFDDNHWGNNGFRYTSSVPYEHRIYEFQIPLSDINADIGDEIGYGFGCYGTVVVEDIYVDDNTCPETGIGTLVDPYCSIQDGVDAVPSGGTVYVAEGEYKEEGLIYIDHPLTLVGAGCGLTAVNATGFDWGFFVSSDNVTIQGFSIYGALYDGIYLSYGTGYCSILDNCIYENAEGITLWNSSHNTIRGNEIYLNGSNGIWLSNGSSDNLIEGNNIYQNENEWSCPFLYSWDGSEYLLDSQLFAIGGGTDSYYYDELEHLAPTNDEYLIKITEEMYETAYIDEVKLVTVDHPVGTQIITDIDGDIHTVRSLGAPTTGFEEDGTDCLAKVSRRDGVYWTSNMDNKDLAQDEDLRDSIILTFDKPSGAQRAKVVASFRNTPLFEQVNRVMMSLPLDDTGKARELRRFVTSPYVEVWDGDNMIFRDRLNKPGSYVDREDIRIVDVSGVDRDEVTIKIESMTGLTMIDSVGIDYSTNEAIFTFELPATGAVDGDGVDVLPQVLSSDDNCLVMVDGDSADLSFAEPAPLPGHERSYLIKAFGYYDSPFITDIGSETRRDLLEQFLADPYYAMRYSLEKSLKRDSHCGIRIGSDPWTTEQDDDCDNNVIKVNQIHVNNGDGIYLNYADYTTIMGNEIYSNENTGINIYNSNSSEIYCNDIYGNNPTNLSGIHLSGTCANSVINYNNIYGNGYGVYNEIGNEVNAENNWWGCAAGPGNSGCDDVTSDVDYTPWLSEKCTDCPYGEDEEIVVGGEAFPVDKMGLIATWVALAMVIAAGGFYLVRRRTHS